MTDEHREKLEADIVVADAALKALDAVVERFGATSAYASAVEARIEIQFLRAQRADALQAARWSAAIIAADSRGDIAEADWIFKAGPTGFAGPV